MVYYRFSLKIVLILAIFNFHTSAWANSTEAFYQYFSSAQYSKALMSLEHIDLGANTLSIKAYLSGITYSKMQEYNKAIPQFELALKYKNESLDLHYEYGQALYAANELKKAQEMFKVSANKPFNRPASLYYVAHIAQMLEDFKMAKSYYYLVIKDKDSDIKIKQIAYFQLAEVLLSMIREKIKSPKSITEQVDKIILPLMARAHELAPSTAVAADIGKRSAEIMTEFNLDPNLLSNGRRINPKRYNLSFSQKIKYDDNVSLVSEENNVEQTKKKSFIFETEAAAKYNFVIKKRFIMAPDIRFTFVEHSNRHDSEVYQNNSLTSNFNLKNKYEHKYKEQPASLIFDIDHSRISKDWNQRKKREFYASSTTLTLGENFTYFPLGDTTLKFKRKSYNGSNESINNYTNTLSANQNFFLAIHHLVIALFEISFIDNYNNTASNTDTYLLRFDYLIPQIFPQYTLGLGLATTITDTKEAQATKGTELTLNPSLDLSKDINATTKIGINYDFTKNKSKDINSTYTKHVFTTEVSFDF